MLRSRYGTAGPQEGDAGSRRHSVEPAAAGATQGAAEAEPDASPSPSLADAKQLQPKPAAQVIAENADQLAAGAVLVAALLSASLQPAAELSGQPAHTTGASEAAAEDVTDRSGAKEQPLLAADAAENNTDPPSAALDAPPTSEDVSMALQPKDDTATGDHAEDADPEWHVPASARKLPPFAAVAARYNRSLTSPAVRA